MKKHTLRISLTTIIFFLILIKGFAQENKIIPVPQELKEMRESFVLIDGLKIIAENAVSFEANYLRDFLMSEHGLKTQVTSNGDKEKNILLRLDTIISNQEGYFIEVTSQNIQITGSTNRAVFYGIQTLRQWMWNKFDQKSQTLEGVIIRDQPRFEYRALMLDPARHFLPLKDLKRYIDVMAQYKYNHLHLHLSDDQGWRIEIKKYPKLTEVASIRIETEGDKKVHAGIYTQKEMKSLVEYAAERHISIIPEIDVPGHSVAAIAAYPELTCFEGKYEVRTTVGVSNNLLCAGKEEVFLFLDDIIAELAKIFPEKKFHIGGDEAPLDHWKQCSSCQRRMKEESLSSPRDLMAYFFQRVNKSLQKHNKIPLFWYEIDVPKYPEKSILYAWRAGLTNQVIENARQMGFKVICSPGEYAYFDYPQWPGEELVDWMALLPLETVYKFDPGYGLPAEKQAHIIGVEGTLWGEYIKNINRAFYMTWPRAMALAEAGWSNLENRSWNNFKKKLDVHTINLLYQGINYRPPIEVYGN